MELMVIWLLGILAVMYFFSVNGMNKRLDALRTDLAQLKADVVGLRTDMTVIAKMGSQPAWTYQQVLGGRGK